MTGLDPDKDVVVEIATLITDDDLAIVAEGPDLVIHQPPEVLDRMGDFVRAMHTKSGLPVSYTHLRAHETGRKNECRLLL